MPRIIVNAFLTLDGVMQAPGGPDEDRENGFVHGGWQGPLSDEAVGRLVMQGLADADGFVLGRKTYDIFSNYWPQITDSGNAIAAALNTRPKYVASRRLDHVAWNNAHLIEGDLVAELRRLRAQPGQTLQTWGSTDLMQTLLEHDLIDELRMFIFPVLLGSGKRLFGSGTAPAAFKSVEAVPCPQGAVYQRLQRHGAPRHGQIGA